MRCEAGDEGGQLIGWYVQSQSKYFLFKINKRNMIYLSNLYKSEMYLYQCAVHQKYIYSYIIRWIVCIGWVRYGSSSFFSFSYAQVTFSSYSPVEVKSLKIST